MGNLPLGVLYVACLYRDSTISNKYFVCLEMKKSESSNSKENNTSTVAAGNENGRRRETLPFRVKLRIKVPLKVKMLFFSDNQCGFYF